MPTIWSRGPKQQDLTDEETRGLAEKCHHQRLRIQFQWHFIIIPSEDAEIDEDYDKQAKRREICLPPMLARSEPPPTVTQLSHDVVRKFCFKDCMVYNTAGRNCDASWRADLYWRVYRRWYPSRAKDVDISHESFFCHIADFPPAGNASISQLVDQVTAFHKHFYGVLEQKVSELPDLEPPGMLYGAPADNSLLCPLASYTLRSTFGKCFLMMHDDEFNDLRHDAYTRKDTGAFIVWLRAEDVVEDTRNMTPLTGADLSDDIRVYHCETLESAVRSVLLSTGDPDRSEAKQEWHGYYEELLDQNQTDYDQLCHCRRCPGKRLFNQRQHQGLAD